MSIFDGNIFGGLDPFQSHRGSFGEHMNQEYYQYLNQMQSQYMNNQAIHNMAYPPLPMVTIQPPDEPVDRKKDLLLLLEDI